MVKSKVKVPVQIPPYRYNGGVGRRYRQYGFDGTVDLSSSCVTGGRLRGSILASSKLWNGWDWGELFWWMGGCILRYGIIIVCIIALPVL